MPTYPTPNPSVKVCEQAYLDFLLTIPYLQPNNGGTCVGVAEPGLALNLSQYQAPAAILAFQREDGAGENRVVGGALFQTVMSWSIYVISASFSPTGEGRLAGIETGPGIFDPGAYAMIDDFLAALNGKVLSLAPVSKAFPDTPVAVHYLTTENQVIYRMTFRNQWLREGV